MRSVHSPTNSALLTFQSTSARPVRPAPSSRASLSVPVGKRGLRMRQVLGALRLLGGATSSLLLGLDGGDALRNVARSSSRQSGRCGHGGVRSLIGQGLRRCRRTARRADLADAERLHIVGNAAGGSCESHAQTTCQHARHACKADDLQRQPTGAVCIPFLQTKPFGSQHTTRPPRRRQLVFDCRKGLLPEGRYAVLTGIILPEGPKPTKSCEGALHRLFD